MGFEDSRETSKCAILARATAGHAERVERRARALQRLSDGVANVLDIGDASTFWSADEMSDGGRPQPRLKSALVEACARSPLR